MEKKLELRGSPAPVQIREAGITLIAPGLRGKGSYSGARPVGQTRAATGERTALDAALREAGLEDRHTLVLDAQTPATSGAAPASRAGLQSVPEGSLRLEVANNPGEFQFVMYTDEAGVVTFHYPERPSAGAVPASRAAAQGNCRYDIPLRQAKAAGAAEGNSRGLFGAIGSKIVKIVVGKVFAGKTGTVAHWAVRKWEEHCRPYSGLHGGKDFAELIQEKPKAFDQWGNIRGKKALLFIHGTSSYTGGAFAGLKKVKNGEIPQELYQRYGGRVLGFNHHTMSIGVADNVKQFYDAFSQHPGEYHFDIICHSRGGLVARALTQLPDAFLAKRLDGWKRPAEVKINIDRVVFVATPNGGTHLAKPGNIPDAVQLLANYVNMLPDSLLTIGGGMILSLASAIAEAGLPHIPGLEDQGPDSELVKALTDSQTDAGRYYGFEASFTTAGKLMAAAKAVGIFSASASMMVKQLFGDLPNDLVVPTKGVADNSHFKLGAERVVSFEGEHVHHTNFFFQPEIKRLLDFLPGT